MQTIAKKFASVLQCDSKCRIALQLNCKTKNIILFFFSLNYLPDSPNLSTPPPTSLSLSLRFLHLLCFLLVISPSPFTLPQATVGHHHPAMPSPSYVSPNDVDRRRSTIVVAWVWISEDLRSCCDMCCVCSFNVLLQWVCFDVLGSIWL